ncbi:hypothetical protein COO60DRAFT_1523033 [Scenedesmus sp. NREL 46B-D3]|nr:hypothetical protein COO60DRAFT_1523033 [Scenedesmus sp. NREL 46B-D3]
MNSTQQGQVGVLHILCPLPLHACAAFVQTLCVAPSSRHCANMLRVQHQARGRLTLFCMSQGARASMRGHAALQAIYLPTVTCAGCVRSTNQAEFGLGPFGSWRVAIRGSWLAAGRQQPSNTALVVFDEFGVQLTGWLVKLPKQLPEVRVRLPGGGWQQQEQPAALWQTTYLAGAYRVGRGSSGNIFLFRRR